MFNYCPKCSSDGIRFEREQKFICPDCNWVFYKSIAAAVVGVLAYQDKILFQIRAREPKAGMLDMPGGFIDINENAENALSREIHEEMGLVISQFRYLGSAPNVYLYKGITYNVCDMIYTSTINSIPTMIDPHEVKEIALLNANEINRDEIAFPSIVAALELYQNSQKGIGGDVANI